MERALIVLGFAVLIVLYQIGAEKETAPAQADSAAVVASSDYAYIGPPTISRDVYASVFCEQSGTDSQICQQAPAMYDAVVAAGADPALELAHAGNESSFGTGGVGMAPWHNLHGIHGHSGGLGTPFQNSAPGDENMQEYDNYPDAVADWVWLIRDGGLYYPTRNDPESVLAIYCECGGDSGKADYVAKMKAQIDGWRAQSAPQSSPQAAPAPQANGDIRSQIVQLALDQVGKPYVLGAAGPGAFDCSGLVHWVYAQQGIETGRTTFDQLPRLRPIAPEQIQMGDMVYFQFSWDQHTGILADVDNDGRWDMINAGTPQIGVVVTNNVFGDPFWTNAIIGYRTAL